MSHLRVRSSALATHLYEACCCTPEDQQRIARSGQLLPAGSLKFKAVRNKLSWVRQLPPERFFTEKRVQQASEQILTEHQLELPCVPGFTVEGWVSQQTRTLTKTLQRARKSQPWIPRALRLKPGIGRTGFLRMRHI